MSQQRTPESIAAEITESVAGLIPDFDSYPNTVRCWINPTRLTRAIAAALLAERAAHNPAKGQEEIDQLNARLASLSGEYQTLREGASVDARLGQKLIQQRDAACARIHELEALLVGAKGEREALDIEVAYSRSAIEECKKTAAALGDPSLGITTLHRRAASVMGRLADAEARLGDAEKRIRDLTGQ